MAATLLAQEPSREQMEAMIGQMPKLPNSGQVTIGHLWMLIVFGQGQVTAALETYLMWNVLVH